MHIVKLYILSGRDVADSIAVFLGQVGERVHLVCRESTKRDLDPLHARCIPDGIGPLGGNVREREFANRDTVCPVAVEPQCPGCNGKHYSPAGYIRCKYRRIVDNVPILGAGTGGVGYFG